MTVESKVGGRSAAAAEWRMYWPLVIAGMLGFSLHSVFTNALGLFMDPLDKEFGWSRTMISSTTIIPTIFMVLFSPVTGAFIDRHGSRKLAIPCIALTGASLAVLGLASGSVVEWFALTAFYGAFSLGVKVTVWTTAITNTFYAARGLALGITVCGSAFSQIFVPPVTQFLVDNFGWREAFFGLGIGWSVPCLILALLFLRDRSDMAATAHARPADDAASPTVASELTGLSFGEALRSVPLLRLALSTFLTMIIGTAMMLHQVPILTSTGASRADAAWLASLAGVAGIGGKLLTGWLVDRYGAGWVGPLVLTTPAIAYLLLLQPGSSLVPYVIAMMIVGYTTGAKLQICAYLTANYAGMRNYGKIFGMMASIIAAAGSIGAIAAGVVYDLFGNYDRILIFGVFSSFACGALIFRLGRIPDWNTPQPA